MPQAKKKRERERDKLCQTTRPNTKLIRLSKTTQRYVYSFQKRREKEYKMMKKGKMWW